MDRSHWLDTAARPTISGNDAYHFDDCARPEESDACVQAPAPWEDHWVDLGGEG